MKKTSRHIYGFEPYRPADVHRRCCESKHITHITSPDASDTEKSLIWEVVEKEQPIHFKLLCRRIASLYTRNEKMNSTLYWKIATIISARNLLGDKLIMYMNFVCTRDYDKVAVRYRTDDKLTERLISQICPEELMQAIRLVLSGISSMGKGDLIDIVRNELGYITKGSSIYDYLNKCIEIMQYDGIVTINNDKVGLTAKGRTHEYRMGEFSKVRVLDIPPIEKVSEIHSDVFCDDEKLWCDDIVVIPPKNQTSEAKRKSSKIKRASYYEDNTNDKEKKTIVSPHRKGAVPAAQNLDAKNSEESRSNKSKSLKSSSHEIPALPSSVASIPEKLSEHPVNTRNVHDGETKSSRLYVEWPYWYGDLFDDTFCKSCSSLYGIAIGSNFSQKVPDVDIFVQEIEMREVCKEETQHIEPNTQLPDACYHCFVDETVSCISANSYSEEPMLYTDIISYINLEEQLRHDVEPIAAEEIDSQSSSALGITRFLLDLRMLLRYLPCADQIGETVVQTFDSVRKKYYPESTHRQGEIPYVLAVIVAAFPIPGLARIITAQYISGIVQMLLCLFVWKWCYMWWALDFYRILTCDFLDSEGNELKNYSKSYAAAGFIIYSFIVASLMPSFLRW